jgi:hypothetical protein
MPTRAKSANMLSRQTGKLPVFASIQLQSNLLGAHVSCKAQLRRLLHKSTVSGKTGGYNDDCANSVRRSRPTSVVSGFSSAWVVSTRKWTRSPVPVTSDADSGKTGMALPTSCTKDRRDAMECIPTSILLAAIQLGRFDSPGSYSSSSRIRTSSSLRPRHGSEDMSRTYTSRGCREHPLLNQGYLRQ